MKTLAVNEDPRQTSLIILLTTSCYIAEKRTISKLLSKAVRFN